MLLRTSGFLGPKSDRPFHFDVAWATHQDYQNVVHQVWFGVFVNMVEGLNRVHEDFIIFNKTVFGNIFHRKHLLEARLAGI